VQNVKSGMKVGTVQCIHYLSSRDIGEWHG